MIEKLAALLLRCREIANPEIATAPVVEAMSRCLRKTSLAVPNFDKKSVVVLQGVDRVISMLLQSKLIIFLNLRVGPSPLPGQVVDIVEPQGRSRSVGLQVCRTNSAD